MDFIKITNQINKELIENGLNTIYSMIASNISSEELTNLIETNTKEYNNLSKNDQIKYNNYLKGLIIQSKIICAY